ncbi:hypothetical protein CKO28_06165 [Rhodovibrio sodomensis]|uniref:Sodium/calcium exchanger membrane region domain-containing protein n=1 Tax=Rhodovibrio sodomensis TaxID=1088 RepID=A0ABS1DAZ1_9PROT|nr:calcium/sodium antiporter [Rhodovibrio sodomensis]MBK1667617.1 hypothetical protein [Rhodovibrio sodomensis]
MPPLIELGLGLIVLVAGGEILVRGAVAAANRLGVSPLLIGLVLVGLGTSAPELVTSIKAALSGAPGLAVGNVVGSNIANVLLILGTTALVAPIAVNLASLKRDAGAMLIATALASFALLGLDGIGRGVGIGFLLALAAYLIVAYRAETRDPDPASEVHTLEAQEVEQNTPTMGLMAALGLTAAGLALTLLGANWLVSGAIWLASSLGMSDAVIGLTVVAIGTSLPELTAGIIAALRGHAAVALGNVLGSNIYNLLLILGATGVVAPITTPADLSLVDVGLMAAAALVLVPIAMTGLRISRREGAVLLATYGAYLTYLLI